MAKTRIIIRVSAHQKNTIKKVATEFGYNMSEYVKLKILHENEDLNGQNEIFTSPHPSKNNVITISILYRIFYIVKRLLTQQGKLSVQDIAEVEKQALEYAQKTRSNYGYKYIDKANERFD